MVFDKAAGTYTFDPAAPIESFTTYSTSSPTATTNYDTQGNSSPEIVVQQYSSTFYGVLTAASGPSGATSGLTAGGDMAFATGETLSETAVDYLNVNTTTVGVGSDTVQSDALLNFDFYTANPVTGTGSSAVVSASAIRAYADAISVTVGQLNLGANDIAILLKLHSTAVGYVDTTKLLIVDSTSDYVLNTGSNPATYTVNVTEANYDSAHYQISGVQIVTSTEGLSGTGYSLSTGAAVTLTEAGKDLADTSDADIVKIIKIDVLTSSSQTADTDLSFTGNIVDGDADSAPFSFNVHLEGDSANLVGGDGADTLTSGAGNNSLNGMGGVDTVSYADAGAGVTVNLATGTATGGGGNDTLSNIENVVGSSHTDTITGTTGANELSGGAGDDTLIGGLGNDTLIGGAGSDTFKWSLGETGADKITDFNLAPVASGGDVLDLSDLLTGEHANATSLDAYLNFSANGSGQTVITVDANAGGGTGQSITLENVQYSDLQALAGGGGADAAILAKLLTDGNLKTDV
jgi:Ca2+-binding RTX toxin-like protein